MRAEFSKPSSSSNTPSSLDFSPPPGQSQPRFARPCRGPLRSVHDAGVRHRRHRVRTSSALALHLVTGSVDAGHHPPIPVTERRVRPTASHPVPRHRKPQTLRTANRAGAVPGHHHQGAAAWWSMPGASGRPLSGSSTPTSSSPEEATTADRPGTEPARRGAPSSSAS